MTQTETELLKIIHNSADPEKVTAYFMQLVMEYFEKESAKK